MLCFLKRDEAKRLLAAEGVRIYKRSSASDLQCITVDAPTLQPIRCCDVDVGAAPSLNSRGLVVFYKFLENQASGDKSVLCVLGCCMSEGHHLARGD